MPALPDEEPVKIQSAQLLTLSSGKGHICVVTQSAHIQCWGDNRQSQLGGGSDGITLPLSANPMNVSGLVDVAAVATGNTHTCALQSRTGNVFCWGENTFGQLGNASNGPRTNKSIPDQVVGIGRVVQIVSGANHTCARQDDGVVRCWGDNQYAQIGDDPRLRAIDAYSIKGLPANIVTIAAGGNHNCALTSAGIVWCWGENTAGQSNGQAGKSIDVPVQVADIPLAKGIALTNQQSCIVDASNTLWCWGHGTVPHSIALPAPYLRLRGSNAGTLCAVLVNNTLVCMSDEESHLVQTPLFGALDISITNDSTCVLLRAAKIVCRGDNQFGQLGPTITEKTHQEFVLMRMGVTANVMAGGVSHMCALWQQGRVKCWGRNLEGQLGTPIRRDDSIPLSPEINGVTSISAGGEHTCALRYDQHVYCWGNNEFGQLGVKDFQNHPQPQQIWALKQVAIVSAGNNHTCVLQQVGRVWCWGANNAGQLGNTGPAQALPIAIEALPSVVTLASGGDSNCVLQNDGTVVCWGASLLPNTPAFTPIANLVDIVDVKIGWRHACALRVDGAVLCWGAQSFGQFQGDATSPQLIIGLPPIQSLAIGGRHTCGIDAIHQLWCWGANDLHQIKAMGGSTIMPVPQMVLAGVSHVALGFSTTCALLVIGQTSCWGDAAYGQLGNGKYEYDSAHPYVSGLNDGFVITAGGNFSCAALKHVVSRCWGGNEYGQLGNGTTNAAALPQTVRSNDEVVTIAAGSAHACLIVSDGTVRCWGHNNFGQLGNQATEDSSAPVIAAVQQVIDISLGQSHSCALLQDGGGACWGRNDDGQLGSGNTASSGMPLRVADLKNTKVLKSGGNHTCAVLQSTSVVCWGRNQQGQLGIGNIGPGLSTPTYVPGLNGVSDISLGLDHTCALTQVGQVYCWGWNHYGQVGKGIVGDTAYITHPQLVDDVTNVVAITAGDNHTCVLQQNGDVRCWGDNYSGQLGVNNLVEETTSHPASVVVTGLQNVVAIVAGGAHTCALLQRGDVACWGWNNVGQVGNGAGGAAQNINTPQPVVGHLGITGVGVGANHICMVDSLGTVWCWGDNGFGQLGIGNQIGGSTRTFPSEVDAAANTIAVTSGANHTCALLVTNDLNCWGRNKIGQLGNSFSGDIADSPVPYFVGNFVGVTAFAVGGDQSCAIVSGQIYCWGDNQYGQIASEPVGIGEFRTTPTPIFGVTTAIDVVVGAQHVCALLKDATVTCWGRNNQHQLGYTGKEMSIVPQEVPGVHDVIAITAGDNHTCAVQKGQHVTCWGSNQTGQLGVVGNDIVNAQQVEGINDAIAVAAGSAHTCYLSNQHTITCWGNNAYGQIGVSSDPAGTTPLSLTSVTGIPPATSIAAGGNRSCAILENTELWCWGENPVNLLGVTANPDRNTPVMVQQLWDMRVAALPIQIPTIVPTLVALVPTATIAPTSTVLPTATLIKRSFPTPVFWKRTMP
ncbi:MAG: hypothetical protein NT020_13155 [Chloroflexales bacterium]|nr:hypothetical protein [Chloroflexales bacterium]